MLHLKEKSNSKFGREKICGSILDYNLGISAIYSYDYTDLICSGSFQSKKRENICQRKISWYFSTFFRWITKSTKLVIVKHIQILIYRADIIVHKSNSASRSRLAVLLLLMLQHCFYHGKCKRLFAGRSILPECFYLPDGTDFVFFQFVLQKIIRRDFQSLANVYEYRQAGHFYAALNLPEISSVDIAHFRKTVSS